MTSRKKYGANVAVSMSPERTFWRFRRTVRNNRSYHNASAGRSVTASHAIALDVNLSRRVSSNRACVR